MKVHTSSTPRLDLSVLPGRLAICRLDPDAAVPQWAWIGDLCAVTRTRDELSIVCAEEDVPAGTRREAGWRALKVEGPLDFALTGILASLAAPLSDAGVSIFAISTFDTDYLLVREEQLMAATEALSTAGHTVR